MSDEQPRKLDNYFARGRERLRAMAEACGIIEPQNRELDRLRVYLLEWSQHQYAYSTKPKGLNDSLADYVKSGYTTAVELYNNDGWAMAVIDASIDDLTALPDGMTMRAALRVRYLNEGIAPTGELKIRVFRSGRLQGISVDEADRLADAAEISLIPIVKRRGLPI
jgi:hypothetical protein